MLVFADHLIFFSVPSFKLCPPGPPNNDHIGGVSVDYWGGTPKIFFRATREILDCVQS